MFNRDKREAGAAALRSEVDRLGALSPPNLAGEVMSSVFGDAGPGADGSALTVVTAANEFISEESSWSNEDFIREQLIRIVGEGLQRLEHAFLVHQQVVLVGSEHWELGWSITRHGEAAVAQGTVADALGSA